MMMKKYGEHYICRPFLWQAAAARFWALSGFDEDEDGGGDDDGGDVDGGDDDGDEDY